MKILLLIDILGSGGAQRQFVGLAKLLKERSFTVKAVYYHPNHFYKPILDEAGVENECLEGAANYFKRIFKIAGEVKRFKPDVVISYLDTPNISACLLKAVGFKYKLIASERNTTQKLTIRGKIKFFLMRWADAIVPNSYSQEKFISEHFPNLLPKVTTITNFVDTSVFVPGNETKSDRIIIAARIGPQKNVLRFLDAVKILKDKGHIFKIDWFGSCSTEEAYFALCRAKIEEYGIKDNFEFHNATQNIISEYQASGALCLPSIYEGFPNVVCEAMSCGLPVLCSNVCDNPMIVDDGKNGFLFDPLSAEDMANKIEKFLSLSPQKKSEMALRSRELSLKKFSADTFVKKYIQLFEKIRQNKQ